MGTNSHTHLKALLKKNWIQKKRSICGSLCELLLPFLICLAISKLFQNILERESYQDRDQVSIIDPDQSYFDQSSYIQKLYSDTLSNKEEPHDFEKIPNFIKNCQQQQKPKKVALIPKTNFLINSVASMLHDTYKVGTEDWNSIEDLFKYTSSAQYNDDVCFGIEIPEPVDGKYSYKLIFNDSDIKDQSGGSDFQRWKNYGMATLQNYIDNLILKKETELQVPSTSIEVQIYPIKSSPSSQISADIGWWCYIFGVFLVLPMILSFVRLTSSLITEKERKIREGMKIMGMTNTSFYLSWIITYLIILTTISLLVALALKLMAFQKSDFFLIFFWFQLFAISLLFQALFISSFFSRVKVGTIVAILYFLLNCLMTFGLKSKCIGSAQTACSLSTFQGVSLALNIFMEFEKMRIGVNFSRASTVVNHFSVQTQMLMSLANIAIFAVLAIYLDQVFPNEFGSKKNPLFFLDCILKRKQKKDAVDRARQRSRAPQQDLELLTIQQKIYNSNVEDVPQILKDQENRKEVLKICNLQKTFSGRGKPFKAVDDLNLTMYKDQIFVLLGHNGAGKTTTLQMLSGMLSITDGWAEVNGLDVETQMDEIRNFLGACPQHDVLFDVLTVREHLELFAQFKGISDSQLRKVEVQKLIEAVDLRDKADVWSKNLSGGQKRKLSVAIAFIGGSKIIFLDEPTSGMDTSARRNIWDMLKQYRNDRIVILTTHFMDEADFLGDRIAIMGSGKLICCGSSEFLKERFGVGYNLTIVKSDNNVDSNKLIAFIKSIIPSSNVLSNVSSEIAIQLRSESIGKFPEIFQGLDERKNEFSIESYGISITTLEEVFLKVAENTSPDDPLTISKAQEGQDNEEDTEIDSFDLNSARNHQNQATIFATHFWALTKKRLLYLKRDTNSLICEILLPFIFVAGILPLVLISGNDSHPLIIDPSTFSTPIPLIYSGNATRSAMDSIISELDSAIWKSEFYEATSESDWDQKNYDLRSSKRLGSYYFTNTDDTSKTYSYDAQIQQDSMELGPLFINQMNTAIIKRSTGKSSFKIQLSLNPFPVGFEDAKFNTLMNGILTALICSLALGLIPASLITLIVKEREEKIKHQQLVSGASLYSYWISNYFVDFMKYLIVSVFCVLMILAYGVEGLINGKNLAATILLFILFGWGMVPLIYLIGFIFTNPGKAQIWGFFLNIILGIIGPFIVFVIILILGSSSSSIKVVAWFLRLTPPYCFIEGTVNIVEAKYNTFKEKAGVKDTFDMDVAGGDILMLSIEGFVFFGLVFVVEYFKTKKSLRAVLHREIPYTSKKQDSEVQKEAEKIAASSPNDFSVRVSDLRKVYFTEGSMTKVAVDKVSFGVQDGECFGLLGTNGAGKTTTFKILTGELQQTSGTAHIKGYDLMTQMGQAQRHIGYCPQFDSLIANLTGREHLELYADIKGIPKNLKDKFVSKKIKEMGLSDYQDKRAGTYSGGNKRKLSVAIAMLGNPQIVFLDEPSTGMDPQARRVMWNAISRISTKSKKSSVILTTHSMEEAEALCSKLTIMVNGNFKCLGTLTQIKNKFGQGYEVTVKTEIPTERANQLLQRNQIPTKQNLQNMEEISMFLNQLQQYQYFNLISSEGTGKNIFETVMSGHGVTTDQLAEFILIEKDRERLQQFIFQNIGRFQVLERFSTQNRFKITNTSISIGKVFDVLEKNKKDLNIASYSTRQATIEQIFNNFAQGYLDQADNQQQQQIFQQF